MGKFMDLYDKCELEDYQLNNNLGGITIDYAIIPDDIKAIDVYHSRVVKVDGKYFITEDGKKIDSDDILFSYDKAMLVDYLNAVQVDYWYKKRSLKLKK